MISHITLGTSSFDAAFGFWQKVFSTLGLTLKFKEDDGPGATWAGWVKPGAPRPLIILCTPLNGQPATVGNGQMTAFLADTHKMVDDAYAAAIAEGGRCEGKPGLRPHYHEHYYGAYFRDLDGNKICVCCHDPD